jgi:hypothetical protein
MRNRDSSAVVSHAVEDAHWLVAVCEFVAVRTVGVTGAALQNEQPSLLTAVAA